MSTRWHNQALIKGCAQYALCTTQAEFDALLVKLKQPPEKFLAGNEQALSCTYEKPGRSKRPCVVVCVDASKKQSLEKYYSTLIHESVHVWQEFREYIGEDKPSTEFEAYSIERIAYNLMMEFKKRMPL